MKNIKVQNKDAGKRIDVFLSENNTDISRSSISKLISSNKVLLNGSATKSSQIISYGDLIIVDYLRKKLKKPIEIPIIYEDDDCIVLNKPAGLLTHSKGTLNPEQTVASFIAPKFKDGAGERAGIVHRLDRATSGIIICAKNKKSQDFLQKQFSTRKVSKCYIAIIEAALNPKEAIIDMPIERNPKKPQTFRVGSNGKSAITRYKVIDERNGFEKVELSPHTGRTHQLRVHLAHLGHPIVGDTLYNGKSANRMFLHAYKLELTLPSMIKKTFIAEEPPDFDHYMAGRTV